MLFKRSKLHKLVSVNGVVTEQRMCGQVASHFGDKFGNKLLSLRERIHDFVFAREGLRIPLNFSIVDTALAKLRRTARMDREGVAVDMLRAHLLGMA